MGRQDYETETLIASRHGGSFDDVAHSLRADGFDASEDGTGRGTPLVPVQCNGSNIGADLPSLRRGNGHMTGGVPAIAFSAKDYGADAETDLSPTLRAGGHTTSHANAGVMPAVAFAIQERAVSENLDNGPGGKGYQEGVGYTLEARNKVQAVALRGRNGGATAELSEVPSALRASGGGGDKAHVLTSMVRRLTPRECERLQGFPEIIKSITIQVCADESSENAQFAATHSVAPSHVPKERADAHVLIDLDRRVLRLHSRGRLIWSANIAERPSASPLCMQLDGFARLAVLMTANLVKETRDGGAASLQNISGSLPRWIGSAFARVSGREIDELAADAAPFTAAMDRCMKSITSPVGPSFPNYASLLQTSSSCAALAIKQFIHNETGLASSSVVIESVGGYTNIDYRNKPAADGPRYKALGNSMAVPVMRWILSRVEAVDEICSNPKLMQITSSRASGIFRGRRNGND